MRSMPGHLKDTESFQTRKKQQGCTRYRAIARHAEKASNHARKKLGRNRQDNLTHGLSRKTLIYRPVRERLVKEHSQERSASETHLLSFLSSSAVGGNCAGFGQARCERDVYLSVLIRGASITHSHQSFKEKVVVCSGVKTSCKDVTIKCQMGGCLGPDFQRLDKKASSIHVGPDDSLFVDILIFLRPFPCTSQYQLRQCVVDTRSKMRFGC